MSSDQDWLIQRLGGSGAPLVIDGGMGTELEKSGVPMHGQIWSAQAILTHPDKLREVHENYIRAGAEVIITNTFSSARHMLEPAGLGARVTEINADAVRLALEARDNAADEPVAIAGSICEWVSSDEPAWRDPAAVARSAREQAEIFADAGVDLIAFEMCQQLEFSEAAITAVAGVGLPLWIGVCAQSVPESGRLSVFDYPARDFESLVACLAEFPALCINVMHTPIADVEAAVRIVKRHWRGPIGIYPESGDFVMPNWQFVDIVEPDRLARLASGWLDDQVRLVGGCCGLGPEHIRALRAAIHPQ